MRAMKDWRFLLALFCFAVPVGALAVALIAAMLTGKGLVIGAVSLSLFIHGGVLFMIKRPAGNQARTMRERKRARTDWGNPPTEPAGSLLADRGRRVGFVERIK